VIANGVEISSPGLEILVLPGGGCKQFRAKSQRRSCFALAFRIKAVTRECLAGKLDIHTAMLCTRKKPVRGAI
jgi:hypothetical protein